MQTWRMLRLFPGGQPLKREAGDVRSEGITFHLSLALKPHEHWLIGWEHTDSLPARHSAARQARKYMLSYPDRIA